MNKTLTNSQNESINQIQKKSTFNVLNLSSTIPFWVTFLLSVPHNWKNVRFWMRFLQIIQLPWQQTNYWGRDNLFPVRRN